MAEENAAGAIGLELARNRSRRFGKIRTNASGHFSPTTPDSLHDHGGESYALLSAQLLGVVLVSGQHGIPILDTLGQKPWAEPAGDSKIPSGGGTGPPPRDIDVGRAASTEIVIVGTQGRTMLINRTEKGALGKQPWLFELRAESGSIGSQVGAIA